MRTSLALLAFASILSTAACAGTTSDAEISSGAIAEGEDEGASVREKLTACEEDWANQFETAQTSEDSVRIWARFGACAKDVVDGAVPGLAAKLGASRRSSLTKAVQGQRESDAGYCNELGSLDEEGISVASCLADREAFLARLIITFTSVTREAPPLSADRALHPDCYAAFDDAVKADDSTSATIQASSALATCVGNDVLSLADDLGRALTNAGRSGTEEKATAAVTSALRAYKTSSPALCSLLAQAGVQGAGPEAQLADANCQVRVAESLYTAVGEDSGLPIGDGDGGDGDGEGDETP